MPAEDATAPGERVVGGERQSTNAVDMDIAAIEDPDLRRRIAAAFDRLRGRAEYGLVFEKHKPESVVLHGQPIREDRYATLRARPGPENAFRVVAIDDDKATLQPVDEHFRPDGGRTTEPSENLVPIARFGDPIFPGLVTTGEELGAVDEQGNPSKPFHVVINGENFHALETLLYAYEGQVDCIYIDPPYNTGAPDWKYNNNYVDKDDRYRHSLWLSMMEKRLKLAQRLLNPSDSVLIVTIDEREHLRLGLLLEQTFHEATIQMVTTLIKPSGSRRATEFSRVEEYIFFVMLGGKGPQGWDTDMLPKALLADQADEDEATDENDEAPVTWQGLRRRGSTDWKRSHRPNGFYPLFINKRTHTLHSLGDPLCVSPVHAGHRGSGRWVTLSGRCSGWCATVFRFLPDTPGGCW